MTIAAHLFLRALVQSRRASVVLGDGGGNMAASAISRANSQAVQERAPVIEQNGIHPPPPAGTEPAWAVEYVDHVRKDGLFWCKLHVTVNQ